MAREASNTPTPIGSPTPCAHEPWGWFEGALMLTLGAEGKIGCPVADARTLNAASQDFERGVMISCEHDVMPGAKIYVFVLYDDSTYDIHMPG